MKRFPHLQGEGAIGKIEIGFCVVFVPILTRLFGYETENVEAYT
jgi:hypothetical protein